MNTILKCAGWNNSDGIFLCEKEIAFPQDQCEECLQKVSYVKKMPSGKYRVLSEKGKNLGESTTLSKAKKRLQQVEYFKHLNKKRRRKRKRAMMWILLTRYG